MARGFKGFKGFKGFVVGVAVTLALLVGGGAVLLGLNYLSHLIVGHVWASCLVWLGLVLLWGGMMGAAVYNEDSPPPRKKQRKYTHGPRTPRKLKSNDTT